MSMINYVRTMRLAVTSVLLFATSMTFAQSAFEAERNKNVVEIVYTAEDFKELKETGHYGISFLSLPWKVIESTYVGYNVSPLNFNWGLGSVNTALFKFGPAIGYYFTPKIFVALPVNVVAEAFLGDGDDEDIGWAISIDPTIYTGYGVFLGPTWTNGFGKAAGSVFGFRAGIYF